MDSALVKDSMRFKTSKPFQEILNRLTADIPRQEAAHPELASMDAVSKLCVLYRMLWEEEAYFAGAEAAGVGAIRRYTLENLEAERLHFDDATAICYLYLKQYDYSDYPNIRQVIGFDVLNRMLSFTSALSMPSETASSQNAFCDCTAFFFKTAYSI